MPVELVVGVPGLAALVLVCGELPAIVHHLLDVAAEQALEVLVDFVDVVGKLRVGRATRHGLLLLVAQLMARRGTRFLVHRLAGDAAGGCDGPARNGFATAVGGIACKAVHKKE